MKKYYMILMKLYDKCDDCYNSDECLIYLL